MFDVRPPVVPQHGSPGPFATHVLPTVAQELSVMPPARANVADAAPFYPGTQCTNAPMHQCTNASMHQCTNAPIRRT
jgi:hypothetical protein